jgi:rhamnose transport system ATP-binding protein
VLRGVTFTIRPGESVALVGRSGAGKSTLLKLINRLLVPDAGSVRVQGRDTREWDPIALRRRTGYVLQDIGLFPHLTVAENIALALEGGGFWRRVDWRRRRENAAALLARVGSAIDPMRTVDTLSMPEQQVVEIAKAIGADARIVVMDEPTASLTTREVEGLFQVIGRLREAQVGVIYISHRLEEIFAVADRITVLDHGQVIANGTPSEVRADPQVRAVYLGEDEE